MSHQLVIEPEAEDEVDEVAAWYESEAGLGAKFVDAVERALSTIERNPYQYQIIYRDARRVMLSPFPYGIIYRATNQVVIVLGCMHGHRDPKRWQSRIE